MNKTEGFTAARKSVHSHADSIEYDGAVVVTYNSETQQCVNWYSFSNHSTEFGPQQLNEMAQRMAAFAAESWKQHVENPGTNKVAITPVKKIHLSGPQLWDGRVVLACVALQWPDALKPLHFHVEAMMNEAGLSVRFYEGEMKGMAYWSLRVLIGPIAFWLWRST